MCEPTAGLIPLHGGIERVDVQLVGDKMNIWIVRQERKEAMRNSPLQRPEKQLRGE